MKWCVFNHNNVDLDDWLYNDGVSISLNGCLEINRLLSWLICQPTWNVRKTCHPLYVTWLNILFEVLYVIFFGIGSHFHKWVNALKVSGVKSSSVPHWLLGILRTNTDFSFVLLSCCDYRILSYLWTHCRSHEQTSVWSSKYCFIYKFRKSPFQGTSAISGMQNQLQSTWMGKSQKLLDKFIFK